MELRKASMNNHNLSLFETTGFSMWPFVKQGEKLIIKKVPIEDLRIGDIILYRKDNQLICHRLIRKVKNQGGCLLYTRGDSSTALPEFVTGQMFLGKAIGIIRNDKTINLGSLRWQFINRLIVIIAPLVSIGIRIGKILFGKR